MLVENKPIDGAWQRSCAIDGINDDETRLTKPMCYPLHIFPAEFKQEILTITVVDAAIDKMMES